MLECAGSHSRVGFGEMTEWPKVHDWKSCVSQGTEGSNPSLSAGKCDSSVALGVFGRGGAVCDSQGVDDPRSVNSARSGRKQR